MDKIILHSDLNNFYASVECAKNPELADKCVAVCGNIADRKGIVLAKNQNAKKYGVQTGEVIWKAKQKCPDLITVPPDFQSYYKYSQLVRSIYYSFTDLIEPFGIDECWLDVTGSTSLFGTGEEIAEKIRKTVKEETNLTVSVGVSFNKIFAKLASDIKKPDAVTPIPRSRFKEIVWRLPAEDLLGVGRRTIATLKKHNIITIGDIAMADSSCLESWFGKHGLQLWQYANGLDNSPVTPSREESSAKSIGHGITCPKDLTTNEEVFNLISFLTTEISYKLKRDNMVACGVSVTVKDCFFSTCDFQTTITTPTQSSTIIARAASELFESRYKWDNDIRAVTVTAINLSSKSQCQQTSFFENPEETEKMLKLENCLDELRSRFGDNIIKGM